MMVYRWLLINLIRIKPGKYGFFLDSYKMKNICFAISNTMPGANAHVSSTAVQFWKGEKFVKPRK